MKSFKKIFGTEGEKLARAYLERKGYTFLCRNFESAHGELDLVMEKDGEVVFVEVKTMTEKGEYYFGSGANKITPEKIRRITLAAHAFIDRHAALCRDKSFRFDVMEVTLTRTEARFHHIQNAFAAQSGFSRKKLF